MASRIQWLALCALVVAAVVAGCTTAKSAASSDCSPGSAQCESPVAGIDASMGGNDADRPPTSGSGTLPCAIDKILHDRCQTCHGATTQYGAPMSLTTWSDLHAPLKSNPSTPVYEQVGRRIMSDAMPMPPPPNPRVDIADTAALEAWIAIGAPMAAAGESCASSSAGPPSDSGVADAVDESYGTTAAQGPSDCKDYYDMQAHGASVSKDTTPYPVPNDTANAGNKYVCFYFTPPYAADSQGLWFSPILDQTRVLHHWLLYATNSAASQPDGTVQTCQAVAPGWYLVAGWAPGSPAAPMPPDVGLQMPPPTGSLILQVHYYDLQGLGLSDRSGVRFCTAPKDTRPHLATVTFTGSEAICLPPKSTNNIVSGPCVPRKDMGDIHIVNVWPHMHKLGTHMQITITRNEAGVEMLQDTPFNFNSQFQYPKDVVLHPGDTMQTNCTYDNPTDTKVHFGENTQDEMCYGFVTAWPANALVTDPATQNITQVLGQYFQQQTRCLDAVSILQSCNGLADYPVAK